MTATRSKPTTGDYTIKVLTIEDLNDVESLSFLRFVASCVNEKYGKKFNGWPNFDVGDYIQNHRIAICKKHGMHVGLHMAQIYRSVFDPSVVILKQDLLYVLKGNHRAARMLMGDFIDFGKAHANHIITMIGEHTNIKPRSLERLGFKKLETLYRMES